MATTECFKAARISVVLIDDGLELDKMYNIEWHKKFVPFVGRIVRIEREAEKILDAVRILFQVVSYCINSLNESTYLLFSPQCVLCSMRSKWLDKRLIDKPHMKFKYFFYI